ncbi:MAG: MFS transporter, partial [Kiritimatiellae bacterium]|nr:MFS transporter [Kiritimatiellia bacterium]
LFLNMMVAWLVSDRFLVVAERHGYGPLLFALAFFAAVYFVVAALLLPETKGKTLAEIEALFQ